MGLKLHSHNSKVLFHRTPNAPLDQDSNQIPKITSFYTNFSGKLHKHS